MCKSYRCASCGDIQLELEEQPAECPICGCTEFYTISWKSRYNYEYFEPEAEDYMVR